MLKPLLLITLIASSIVTNAHGRKQPNPCTSDIKKYCLAQRSDQNAMAKCLYDNKEKLNDDCREKMDNARQKVKNARTIVKKQCGEDIQKHCPNLDGQPLRKCTESKRKLFSKSCQKTILAL